MSSTLGRLTAIVALMVAPTSSNPTRMGWFSPCLPAADVPGSLAYYESIGFYQTGGDPEHGWVTLACGATEMALMSFLQTPLLCFRGADIPKLCELFTQRGLAPSTESNDIRSPGYRRFEASNWPEEYSQDTHGNPLPSDDSGDFSLFDADGNKLYFDSVPLERTRFEANERFGSEQTTGDCALDPLIVGQAIAQVQVSNIADALQYYAKIGFVAGEVHSDATTVELRCQAENLGLSLHHRDDKTACTLIIECNDPAQLALHFQSKGIAVEHHASDGSVFEIIDPSQNVLRFRQTREADS